MSLSFRNGKVVQMKVDYFNNSFLTNCHKILNVLHFENGGTNI